jgi:hypothetical protein
MKLNVSPIFDPQGSPFELERESLTPRAFVDLLDRHKAVVIRHSTSDNDETPFSVEDFGQFVVDCQLEYYPYVGGAAPRRIIPVQASTDPIVFTANERYVCTAQTRCQRKERTCTHSNR